MIVRMLVLLAEMIFISFRLCVGGQLQQAETATGKNQYSKIEKSPATKSEKKTMTTLPLGITDETPLDKVELVYGFYSSKTGAGRQEITLTGDGTVKLFFSRSYNDSSPKIMEAKCGGDQIMRLLDLLEGMGFYGLPEHFSSSEQAHARRLLKFTMPGRQKVIAVDEPGNYAIEQCIGAIKLCAGLCIPEALNQRFFPNL